MTQIVLWCTKIPLLLIHALPVLEEILAAVQVGCMRGVPTMAVTATATDAVKADVLKMLKIPRARTFKVQPGIHSGQPHLLGNCSSWLF